MNQGKRVYHKENQPMTWLLIIIMAIIIPWWLTPFYNNPPDQPIYGYFLLPSILIIIIALLFYKLKIEVTDKVAVASFGIGMVKKSVNIYDLLLEQAEIIKTPWIWGVGYRFTPKGTLLNASFSKVLHIPTTSSSFFCGL